MDRLYTYQAYQQQAILRQINRPSLIRRNGSTCILQVAEPKVGTYLPLRKRSCSVGLTVTRLKLPGMQLAFRDICERRKL